MAAGARVLFSQTGANHPQLTKGGWWLPMHKSEALLSVPYGDVFIMSLPKRSLYGLGS
jgi:hypothetical protein